MVMLQTVPDLGIAGEHLPGLPHVQPALEVRLDYRLRQQSGSWQ